MLHANDSIYNSSVTFTMKHEYKIVCKDNISTSTYTNAWITLYLKLILFQNITNQKRQFKHRIVSPKKYFQFKDAWSELYSWRKHSLVYLTYSSEGTAAFTTGSTSSPFNPPLGQHMSLNRVWGDFRWQIPPNHC